MSDHPFWTWLWGVMAVVNLLAFAVGDHVFTDLTIGLLCGCLAFYSYDLRKEKEKN